MNDRAKPQTIASTLFQELELLFVSETSPSELQLLRIHKQADVLAKANASDASLVRAGVAALRWDVAEANYQIRNALALDRCVSTCLNSALTYSALNDAKGAADAAIDAVKCAPNSQQAVDIAIENLVAAGRVSDALALIDQHLKMGLTLEEDRAEIDVLYDHINLAQISEAQIQNELLVAYSLLTDRRLRCRQFSWAIDVDPDGGSCVLFSLGFNGDFGMEMQLEAELAERLALNSEWNPNRLSVEFFYEKKDAVFTA